ncbi:MAG: hypothetical protein RJA22_2663 [Verrucomicrobiota bacterium]|jgi:uncharacterized protein YegL
MSTQAKTPWTDITLVIDRSSSIAGIRTTLLEGINQFLAAQAKETGRTRISLVRFDDQYEIVWDRIPLSEALPLKPRDLVPRGSTALYDAIGVTLERTHDYFAQLAPADRPERVIVAVFTDGAENSSQRFTHATLQELIGRRRQENDWQILFLGASPDVVQEARDLGIDPRLSIQYEASQAGTSAAFQTLSHSVSTLRSRPARRRARPKNPATATVPPPPDPPPATPPPPSQENPEGSNPR